MIVLNCDFITEWIDPKEVDDQMLEGAVKMLSPKEDINKMSLNVLKR